MADSRGDLKDDTDATPLCCGFVNWGQEENSLAKGTLKLASLELSLHDS